MKRPWHNSRPGQKTGQGLCRACAQSNANFKRQTPPPGAQPQKTAVKNLQCGKSHPRAIGLESQPSHGKRKQNPQSLAHQGSPSTATTRRLPSPAQLGFQRPAPLRHPIPNGRTHHRRTAAHASKAARTKPGKAGPAPACIRACLKNPCKRPKKRWNRSSTLALCNKATLQARHPLQACALAKRLYYQRYGSVRPKLPMVGA